MDIIDEHLFEYDIGPFNSRMLFSCLSKWVVLIKCLENPIIVFSEYILYFCVIFDFSKLCHINLVVISFFFFCIIAEETVRNDAVCKPWRSEVEKNIRLEDFDWTPPGLIPTHL